MGKIWVIFEKKSAFSSKWIEVLMASGSGGENVHCEIIIPHQKFARASAWIGLGVAFKDYYPLTLNADHYEVFVIDNVDAEAIYQFHISQLGKQYDEVGLFFSMFLGYRKKYTNPDRWFCSELNYYELTKVAELPLPEIVQHHVTPQMLYLMLVDMGYKAQNLAEII